ncbi:MAG: hypothetical protein M1381_04720 [Deltaproteobacteria bacterium]|nr:hypothetical protein [Deltaproteobacteria bacterium]MCL5791909.1 hypothetical protein [Deltaproteobacteria bacterium]
MAEINLTQSEANLLISMEKHRVDETKWEYPGLGGAICIPLTSANKRENFLLDMSRGRINLLKGKYQNRSRNVIVLVRLCFGGPPHHNPDGQDVIPPHLHVYHEGFGDKWAIEVPPDKFGNPADLWQTLHDFMEFCNIVEPPIIERGLFI